MTSLDGAIVVISGNSVVRNSPKMANAEASLEIVLGRSTAERASR